MRKQSTFFTVEVSVIIVCWNSAGCISRCLNSIYRHTRKVAFEIIVLDNRSADGTAEIVERDFPDVRLFRFSANMGFSKASNYGIHRAQGRYLFLLNPDTCLETDAIDHLADFLRNHADAGCAAPKILEKDGSIDRYSAREFPSVIGAIFTQSGLRKMFPANRIAGKSYLPGFDRESLSTVPCLNGAALMIPRAVLTEVGLLDEQLPMYYEDLDLCARIGRTGKLLYYFPAAVVTHLGAHSANRSPGRMLLYAMEKGQAPWMYLLNYRGKLHALLFTLIIFLGSLSRILLLSMMYPFARIAFPSRSGGISDQLKKSLALLKWSLAGRDKFSEYSSRLFDHDAGVKELHPIDIRRRGTE